MTHGLFTKIRRTAGIVLLALVMAGCGSGGGSGDSGSDSSSGSGGDSGGTGEGGQGGTAGSAIIVDHECAQRDAVLGGLDGWVAQAGAQLHIAYGHTSHGSQITTGMTGLYGWKGSLYAYGEGGSAGALDLRDNPFSGAYDLGNPDRATWAASTRTYLDAHPEVNVVMWSWCGQVSTASESDIKTYLRLMNGLENDYPAVSFVYMTGHLDGTGLGGNLNKRNEQIRKYCLANNKILYDFADIESYDPDGNEYLSLYANDACDYVAGGATRNWAREWQESHTEAVDWYSCTSEHSEALNANLKAYAAWWLWARLAGWDGQSQ